MSSRQIGTVTGQNGGKRSFLYQERREKHSRPIYPRRHAGDFGAERVIVPVSRWPPSTVYWIGGTR
jgi:hypothetical protein